MTRKLSSRLLVTLLMASAAPSLSLGQNQPAAPPAQFDQPALPGGNVAPPAVASPVAPASPLPQPPAANPAATVPYNPPPAGAAGVINGPPGCPPLEDRNGTILHGDPLVDPSLYSVPGWFAAVETDIVKPQVKYDLSSSVPLAPTPLLALGPPFFTGAPPLGFTNQVQLPMPALDWTAAPRVELGYRFGDGCGELKLTYRSVVSEGSEIVPNFDPAGAGLIHGRLDLETVNFDYLSQEYSLGPGWDIKWIVGVTFADLFMDSQGDGVILDQRSSDHFYGVGPHAGLDLFRGFGNTGLAMFGKLDMSMVFGRVHDGFAETVYAGAGQPLTSGATAFDATEAAPTIGVEAGLAWKPWACRRFRLSAGYEFEEWWYVGTANGNHATLSDQGFFLRSEWNY